MGGIFGGSKPQQVAQTPPPPTRDDSAARNDQSEAQRRAANAKGRTSTILTGGTGVETDDSNIKKRSLLGGGVKAA